MLKSKMSTLLFISLEEHVVNGTVQHVELLIHSYNKRSTYYAAGEHPLKGPPDQPLDLFCHGCYNFGLDPHTQHLEGSQLLLNAGSCQPLCSREETLTNIDLKFIVYWLTYLQISSYTILPNVNESAFILPVTSGSMMARRSCQSSSISKRGFPWWLIWDSKGSLPGD